MSNAGTFKSDEISEVIGKAVSTGQTCVMSHLTKGKWHRVNVKICLESQKALMLEPTIIPAAGEDIQIDQPVGMALEIDHTKYIFESAVIGFEPAVNLEQIGKILIRKPASIEQMKRRSFTRVPLPQQMKVTTLFWHRGYNDCSTDVPIESYWQGRMIDLSAGGTMITVNKDMLQNFKQDQFIGMQFTTLPFEKPILVEGQIKHIGAPDVDESISLGIEFLGLEASNEGREKLDKIIEAIIAYQTDKVYAGMPVKEKVGQHCYQ